MEDIKKSQDTEVVEKDSVPNRIVGFLKRNGKKIAIGAVTVVGTVVVGGLIYAGSKMDLGVEELEDDILEDESEADTDSDESEE